MAAIIAESDVIRILRSAPPSGKGRIRIGSGAQDNLSSADTDKFILEAEGEFKAITGLSPVAPFEDILKGIIARIAAYWIYISVMVDGDGSIPESVKAWYDWANAMMLKVKNGELEIQGINFDSASTSSAPRSQDALEFRDETVRFNNTTDFIQLVYERTLAGSESVYSGQNKSGTRYVRDTDYEILYETGEIRNKSGMPNNTNLYISYRYIVEKKQPSRNPRRSGIYSPGENSYEERY